MLIWLFPVSPESFHRYDPEKIRSPGPAHGMDQRPKSNYTEAQFERPWQSSDPARKGKGNGLPIEPRKPMYIE